MSPRERDAFYEELKGNHFLLGVSLAGLVANWSVVLESTTFDSLDLRVLDLSQYLLRMLVGGKLDESKVELFEERPFNCDYARTNFIFEVRRNIQVAGAPRQVCQKDCAAS